MWQLTLNQFFSGSAVLLTLYAFFPYIKSIQSDSTFPHFYSWLIWGISTCTVFFAQISDGAGVGAFPIAISGIITLYIAYLAYNRRSDLSITLSDKIFLFSALVAIPVWYLTNNPLWSVIIITTIDTLGFGPTIRKVWNRPDSEDPLFYSLFAIRNILVVLALENITLTTVLFPLVMAIACIVIIGLVLVRKKFRHD